MDRIGRYKVVRELGRGAMGVVYHAIDPNIGRAVAIKTINLAAVSRPEEHEMLRERLFREARSAGILSHPGIVTIYDVEQQGDIAYIAMEYVDGPTLDQVLGREEGLSGEMLFSVLGQTAVALDYAHQKGIVHRDVKPANIMIASDGTVKITDFGIAKITTSDQFTMTGSIVGTPHYMSPEHVQGRAVDGRSDQFSLAVVVYEILTGEKPYTGEHLTTVVYKIVTEEPTPVRRINPSLGAAIESALRKAMLKKPEGRYRTCQEFAEALERACSAQPGWQAMPRGGSLRAMTIVDVPQPSVTLPPARPARRVEATTSSEVPARQKSGFLTFLLAMLVAGGLLAVIGWRAAPWLAPKPETGASDKAAEKTPEKTPEKAPEAVAAPNAAAGTPEEPKPSPMSPAEKAVMKTPDPARLAEVPQLIFVTTSPGGATATLDGKAGTACKTPCSLEAAPGRHTVALSLAGHHAEQREVQVAGAPVELPAVVLRAEGGTVMLTSVPAGAAVLVDGKRTGLTTPAQLALAPGSYRIGVEKDGRQATQSFDVHNGISALKIVLDQ